MGKREKLYNVSSNITAESSVETVGTVCQGSTAQGYLTLEESVSERDSTSGGAMLQSAREFAQLGTHRTHDVFTSDARIRHVEHHRH
ncbi:MAG: hypothetical protein ABW185_22490 [Sedimenticola sp.]